MIWVFTSFGIIVGAGYRDTPLTSRLWEPRSAISEGSQEFSGTAVKPTIASLSVDMYQSPSAPKGEGSPDVGVAASLAWIPTATSIRLMRSFSAIGSVAQQLIGPSRAWSERRS